MPSPAEENRRKIAVAKAGHVRAKIYHAPAKPVKGNRAFARKGKATLR